MEDVRERARALRVRGLVVSDVAAEVGRPVSTVYGWVRDLPAPPRSVWRQPRARGPSSARLADEEAALAWARSRMADPFFAAGAALYAGEGAKRPGAVIFTNTDPRLVAFFSAWLRRYFAVDESRLRCRLYLHADLDYEAAVIFWSAVTGVPASRFTKPYRAVADPTRRTRLHEHGCLTVRYACSATHRRVIAAGDVLLSCLAADPA